MSSCQPLAVEGKSPTAQACLVGKSSPFPSAAKQKLRFVGIWRKGSDRNPAMVTARLIHYRWNNLRGVVVDLVIAGKF